MDNSETSTTEDRDDLSEEERNVQIFATQMLKSRIFLGQFQERRYVDPVKGYRDVIVVNDSENDLKKDIDIVRKRLRGSYGHNCWIGLTDPDFIGAPRGYCIWVESDNNTLGHYWYRIKGVRFRKDEIILRLKVLRAMTDNDNTNNLSTESSQNLSFEDNILNLFQNFSWETTYENVKNTVIENLVWFFTFVLTAKNIKEAATFLSILLATGVALSMKGVAFLMEFTLKFMRETSYFVQSATPVMISVVNLVGKVIGGFYLLIAMIWRDSKQPQPRNSYPAIEMPRYNTRSSLTIREIE